MKTPGGIVIGHADHGLNDGHLRFIDTILLNWHGAFAIRHVELPPECDDLMSGLYGPAAGGAVVPESSVRYERRNGRPGPSRLIDMPERPCRMLVVIAGPGNDGPMVYTAYGSQTVAPREWWDSSMKPTETIEAAQFWAEHALSSEASK